MTEARPLGDDQPTLTQASVTSPEPRFTPGTLLAGRYRVIYPLGRGGMGEVYRADDLRLGQAVALKFVRSDLPAEARQRLYAEVRLGRQVSHPNLCRLYDVVEVEGLTFIAMEYVDGEDLASLLARIGHLAADKALDIARDLCAGLQAVHDRGVLHRDLKPANVMIDGHGRARITDFGLAVEQRAAPPRDRAGTALYMSPEQLRGEQITVRSDLYALGLIFYEMIAGRRFFDASTADDLRRQHESDRRPRLGRPCRLAGEPRAGRLDVRSTEQGPEDTAAEDTRRAGRACPKHLEDDGTRRTDPRIPGTSVRLEAAAYHGRPVWFSLVPPWAAPEPLAPGAWAEGAAPLVRVFFMSLALGLPLAGLFLARRNLRRGRGNLKGALRVALFVFGAYSLARLCNADHVADFGGEFGILVKTFAYPLFWAALIWTSYMALEPYARRRWPRILISWERLLAGGWRDPMVGRDVLVGVAAAAFTTGFGNLTAWVPSWLGRPQEAVGWNFLHADALSSWTGVPYRILVNAYGAVLWSIIWLFLLVLLRVLLRRNVLALGAWGGLRALPSFYGVAPLLSLAMSVPFVVLDILVLTRFGLLGFASMTFGNFVLAEFPLTFNATVWWAPRGFVALAAIVALGIYGFRTSLAGKPAFGGEWLET